MSDQIDSLAALRTRLNGLNARGDWQTLLQEAHQGVDAHPDAWEPAYHEGRAMMETGAYEHADHHLLLCMDRFPSLPQFAVLYGYVGGRSLRPEDAIARWASMLSRMPDAPGLYVGLAHAYKADGQLDRAEQLIANRLQRTPNNIPLLVQYADLASQQQQWDVAVTRWAAVRERAPERTDAVIASIAALRQSNRLDEAEALAAMALQTHPDNPELNTSHAAIAAARQDWPAVVQRLQRVVALTPDSVAASVGLVGALQRVGQTAAAEQAAAAGLQHHPDNELLLTEYAGIASRAKRWPDAVERWREAYNRCPPRIGTYMAYIDALEQAEQLDVADEVASEAIGFAPDDRLLLIKHAKLAMARLDMQEARNRWLGVKRKFPDDPDVMEGVLSAKAAMKEEIRETRRDESSLRGTVVKGSMRPPTRPQGPPRGMLPAATALDILLTGAPTPTPVAPAPPKPSGLAKLGRTMRRMFGGS